MNTELVSTTVASVQPVASRSTLLARRLVLLRSRYARHLYRGAQAAHMAGRTDYAAFAMRQATSLYASVRQSSQAIANSNVSGIA